MTPSFGKVVDALCNCAAVLEIIGRQIATASSEADAEGCLGDDHERSEG
jgi:hypothetical protein